MDHTTHTTIGSLPRDLPRPRGQRRRNDPLRRRRHGLGRRLGPAHRALPEVHVENVTGARDAFWSALLISHLDGKGWEECVRLAHEVATLKLGVEGHVERMIDRDALCGRLETPARAGPEIE
jgi:hypothetical protein